MSSAKLAKEPVQGKVHVHISKETGGAYADVREVIKSELSRIRSELQNKANTNGKLCESTDTHANNKR